MLISVIEICQTKETTRYGKYVIYFLAIAIVVILLSANKVIIDLFYLRICAGCNKRLGSNRSTSRQYYGINWVTHPSLQLAKVQSLTRLFETINLTCTLDHFDMGRCYNTDGQKKR